MKIRDPERVKGTTLKARGRSGLASVRKDAVQAANLWKVLSTDLLIWVCTELNYYTLKQVKGTDIPYSE